MLRKKEVCVLAREAGFGPPQFLRGPQEQAKSPVTSGSPKGDAAWWALGNAERAQKVVLLNMPLQEPQLPRQPLSFGKV